METNKIYHVSISYPNTKIKIKLNYLYILSQLFTLFIDAEEMIITKFGKN